MTTDEANDEFKSRDGFDYLHGRPMKTNFKNYPQLDSSGYDSNNGGDGSMQKCLDNVRNKMSTGTVPREQFTKDELSSVLENCKINVIAVPTYSGKKISSLNLKQFDQVHFVPEFCEKIKEMGIPYPTDWHMYMSTTDGQAKFAGSMGGGFSVSEDMDIVKFHSSGF